MIQPTTPVHIQSLMHTLFSLNSLVSLPPSELSVIDRAEVEIVQKLLARIIERNGFGIGKNEARQYEQTDVHQPLRICSPRESLYWALINLAKLNVTDCCYAQNHSIQNADCFICTHLAVVANPDATTHQLSLSLNDLITRMSDYKAVKFG